jgi:hypothetical protein
MDHLFWLTDRYGPRLTGSPQIEEAGDWVVETLRDWGLQNVRKERFEFGKGWELTGFHATMTEPLGHGRPASRRDHAVACTERSSAPCGRPRNARGGIPAEGAEGGDRSQASRLGPKKRFSFQRLAQTHAKDKPGSSRIAGNTRATRARCGFPFPARAPLPFDSRERDHRDGAGCRGA